MSPEVEQAVGLAREFLHRSGALRVGLLVDRGDDREPAVVECARLAPITVTEDGEREELAHGAQLATPVPPLPEVRQIPGIQADAVAGTVAAPPGGIEMLGRALRDIAALLGGRSIAAADFETIDPEHPARPGRSRRGASGGPRRRRAVRAERLMHDPLQREGSRPRRTTFRPAPFMTFSSFRLKLAAAASLLAVAAVSVALLTGGTASGQTIAGQQATAAQLRAAVRAESRKIAATAEGIADAENRLAVLDARVQRRQQQAQDTQDRLIAARVRLTRLERNAEAYQKTLATNLVAAYKTPTPDLLGVAVEAKGFDDLLSQLRFLRDISDRNATILRDTRSARLAVASQTKDLAQLRLKLIELAKQASDDRSQANVLRNALLRKQASQLARRSGAQSRLTTVRARIASLERQQAADALRNSGPQGATDQAPPAPAPGGPPAQGDDAIAKVVAAANQIATTPYVWGGGHGGSASGGYDCSGSLSYALAAAGPRERLADLRRLHELGRRRPGPPHHGLRERRARLHDRRRAPLRHERARGGGTRWSSAMRSTAGFVARHPPGL